MTGATDALREPNGLSEEGGEDRVVDPEVREQRDELSVQIRERELRHLRKQDKNRPTKNRSKHSTFLRRNSLLAMDNRSALTFMTCRSFSGDKNLTMLGRIMI